MKKIIIGLILAIVFFSLSAFNQADFLFPGAVRAVSAQNTVTASDLINLINGMRAGNGLGALAVDGALMACAQNTAQIMAQSSMSWHIGDVSGRVSAFGYNNGNKAFATENFMVGPTTLASIQANWSDYDHMIPATNPAYCHIGAGVAEVNGKVYYVVQAAYPGNSKGCGYQAGSTGSSSGSGSASAPFVVDMSQIIKSIQIATPNAEGVVIHTVENGQSLWSIASAYKVTIEDIAAWNNIVDITALSLNQKLIIPQANGEGRPVTPTPLPTIMPTADASGRYVHVIKEGDTLTTVAKLWGTTIQELMRVNGLEETTTLGLGWKLVIPVTPTATVPPTQTPLPSLTPAPSGTPTLTMTPAPTLTPAPVSASHLPRTSSKTFLLGALLILAVAAMIFFPSRYFYRKK